MAQLVQVNEPRSASERAALRRLSNSLPDSWVITTNIKEHNFSGARRPEIDCVVISPFGVFTLDFKNFRGTVTPTRSGAWGGVTSRDNPFEQLHDNLFPVKELLASHDEALSKLWLNGVVVLTNKNARLDWSASNVPKESQPHVSTIDTLEQSIRDIARNRAPIDSDTARSVLSALAPVDAPADLFSEVDWKRRKTRAQTTTDAAPEHRRRAPTKTKQVSSTAPKRTRKISAAAPARSSVLPEATSSVPPSNSSIAPILAIVGGSIATIIVIAALSGTSPTQQPVATPPPISATAPVTNAPPRALPPPLPARRCEQRGVYEEAAREGLAGLTTYLRECNFNDPYIQEAKLAMEPLLFNSALSCIRSSCDFYTCITSYTAYFNAFDSRSRYADLNREAEDARRSPRCSGPAIRNDGRHFCPHPGARYGWWCAAHQRCGPGGGCIGR
jgi:hypothetical protein